MKSDPRPSKKIKTPDPLEEPTDLGTLWRKHGNKVLLVLAAFFLAVAVVRWQRAQAAQKRALTQANLATAWSDVGQLQRIANPLAPPAMEATRTTLAADINQAVQAVLDDTAATPAQAANAWLARGETYWALSRLPAASPATQSSTQPAGKAPEAYLDLAANAYNQVVNGYASESVPVTIARYGLAAVAEEKHDTEAARTQYKALIESKNFTTLGADAKPTDKSLAEARLAMLDTVAKPALLLPATQPAPVTASPSAFDMLNKPLTGPTGPMPDFRLGTAPPASQPVTMPSATPGGVPAMAPTTVPATQP